MARITIKKAKPPVAPIASLADYVAEIVKRHPAGSTVRTFRGHSKVSHLLKPSLHRQLSHMKEEKNILRELVSLHPSEFECDRTAFDQLVRMQHFSLETRLLDVTFNPLVALYFATRSNPNEDGHVVFFDVEKRSVKYFDSDTVSCIANLASLSSGERNELRKISSATQLRVSTAGKRLLHFIKTEKPYFEAKIRPGDLRTVLLVKPKQNNRRILAQQGAFFIFGLDHELSPTKHNIKIEKIFIPATSKPALNRELDIMNINGSTMFPEIESAAKYIMSKLVTL